MRTDAGREVLIELHRTLQRWLIPAIAGVVIAIAASFTAAPADSAPLPDRSTVAVARAESIMVPEGPFNPTWLYPEGRIDYGVIEWLLAKAVAGSVQAASADDAWETLISASDRVGIMVDVEGVQPHDPLLEALVRQIIDRGVPMRNIIIFAGEESALFHAGYDISGNSPGVRVMASDDRGYRKGITRIALDNCTKIVNLTRLRVDPQIGMYGALANCLAAVPYVDRERMRRNSEQVPEAAARATLRRKIVLHIVDALRPGFRVKDGGPRFETWAHNGVLASTDPVAVDLIGNNVLEAKLAEEAGGGVCPTLDVAYLTPAAVTHRLGVADAENIDVVKIGP
ncbi:MAG: DUF362 domain-containing protein [Armatimonadota bacterium]